MDNNELDLAESAPQQSIPSFESFLNLHNKYPANLLPIYFIYRDLIIKNELRNIRLLDASSFGINEYAIIGEKIESVSRIIYPVSLEENVDLNYLRTLSAHFGELHLCIYSGDTMIYQSVQCVLPK